MPKRNSKTEPSQSLALSKEALIEVSSFLARAWSGQDVEFEITTTDTPYTSMYNDYVRHRVVFTIRMPEITKFKIRDPLARYRVWRQALWHEAMHVYMGFPNLNWVDSWLKKIVANAVEDFRIETLGARVYPGMREETEFAHAVAIHRANKSFEEERATMPKEMVHDDAVIGAFIFRTIAGRIPRAMQEVLGRDEIDAITRLAEGARRDILNGVPLETVTTSVYEELKKLLNNPEPVVSDITLDILKNPFTQGSKIEGAKDVEAAVKEHASELGLDRDLSKPSEDIRREFEAVVAESKRREAEEKAGKERGDKGVADEREGDEGASDKGARSDVDYPIQIPRMLNADDTRLYDPALIARLKDQLRNVRRGFFEVHRSSGEEFDAEEYARGSGRPFLDEERVRMGGIKVLILLDFSGSIGDLEGKYKRAVVALAEALKFIRAKFAVYAFSEARHGVTAVWQIKGFGEQWDRIKSRRLAQIYPNGGTPLDNVYRRLHGIIKNEKPDVVITLTDGRPDDPEETAEVIGALKRETRMVAVAIGEEAWEASYLAELLSRLGYHRSVAVSNLSELPARILWLLSG